MIGTDEKSPLSYTGPPMIPNPLLRQLPPVGPHGLPNTLSAPSFNPTESHLPTFRPVNGVSHSSSHHWTQTHPAPPPHSVHADFPQRRTYPPREQSSNGGALYERNYFQNQAFGMRQRKAARAQQVMTVFFHGAEKRDCAGYKGNRLTLRSFHCLKGLRSV
jgi:hypothetical protein